MALTKNVQSYRWSALRQSQTLLPMADAAHRRRRRVSRAIGLALRPHLERMESRVLLSAYTLSQIGYLDVNQAGTAPSSTWVADAAGNFYGTTLGGGSYGGGTVFEIPKGSTRLTTLTSFDAHNGSRPSGPLTIDASGNLYGTTQQGGASNDGTVFEIARGSATIATLASFNGTNGQLPLGGVTPDAAGNLYGTTEYGGANSDGTVFEIASGSNSITTLVSFSGGNGANPYGITLDGSGNLYGTTAYGGMDSDGTVFKISAGSNTLTTLVTFNSSNGEGPEAGLTLDAAGDLFGTTYQGGNSYDGTVFEIAAGSTTVTTLASFNGTNGQYLNTPVTLDGNGDVYGTTVRGGSNGVGVVFEIAHGTSTVTTLASFNGTNGQTPSGGVVLDAARNVYGGTYAGGIGYGTLFEIANGSDTITTINTFVGTNGTQPYSSVAVDASGDVFGATNHGGDFNNGTAFEVAHGSSTTTTLASFNMQGVVPTFGIAMDASGNLFGATPMGGPANSGTVFEIARGSNAITTIASFNGPNGAGPQGTLTLDASGNIYGATQYGGAFSDGAIFEIAAGSKVITLLASFNGTNGKYPLAGVTVDASGNLFGTTEVGGTYNDGTVFEIGSGSGAITTLSTFNGTNGKYPYSTITFDSTGNAYGTTHAGGSAGDGTVFKIAKGSNTITTWATFTGANGSTPDTGLAIDPSGNLFGTTVTGGAYSYGTVFEIARDTAVITTLVSFNGVNGRAPTFGVALDASGNLYGTTEDGGPMDDGTVYELSVNPVVTLTLASGANPSNAGQSLTFAATVNGVPDGETVTLHDTSANNAVVATGTLSGGYATLNVPAGTLSAGTHKLIAVYAGDGTLPAAQSGPFAQVVQVAPPTLIGAPVINGDNPNGLFNAAGQSSPGTQRSMVEDVVYTFNEPVTITDANSAFTLALAGPAGGTLPTTLYAQAVAGSNGTQWAVSLTGQPEGTIASIANGEYSITINPACVFAAADGTTSMSAGTGRTDQFYRLYGDVFGTQNVTALDYNRFKQSLTTYNPMFDNYNTGNITALDYNLFKKNLSVNYSGDGFVTSI